MFIIMLQKEAKIMFSTPQYNIILDSQEITSEKKTPEGSESNEELSYNEKVKQLNQVMSLRKR